MKSLFPQWERKSPVVRKKHKPEQEQFIKTITVLTENDLTTKLSPYLYLEEIKQPVPTNNNLNLLHLNISSLRYHFHELELRTIYFNIIGLTESTLQTKTKNLKTLFKSIIVLLKTRIVVHVQNSGECIVDR